MATLRITNLTASDYWLNDIYATVPASNYVDVARSPAEISAMEGLQSAVAAGTLSVDTTYSADELAAISADNQPLASPLVPGSLTAEAVAPVAAAAVASAEILFHKALAVGGGGADDVTIYAVNTLPYKVRILDAYALISVAGAGASTLSVRSAAGGGGTLAATLASDALGMSRMTGPNVSVVLTPGATVGLFVRRSDSTAVGEITIVARRES